MDASINTLYLLPYPNIISLNLFNDSHATSLLFTDYGNGSFKSNISSQKLERESLCTAHLANLHNFAIVAALRTKSGQIHAKIRIYFTHTLCLQIDH